MQAVTSARMGRALKELLFQYDWKRVGLLYRPGPYSLAVTEDILNEVCTRLNSLSVLKGTNIAMSCSGKGHDGWGGIR